MEYLKIIFKDGGGVINLYYSINTREKKPS